MWGCVRLACCALLSLGHGRCGRLRFCRRLRVPRAALDVTVEVCVHVLLRHLDGRRLLILLGAPASQLSRGFAGSTPSATRFGSGSTDACALCGQGPAAVCVLRVGEGHTFGFLAMPLPLSATPFALAVFDFLICRHERAGQQS